MARAEINLSGEPCRKATTLKVLGNTFVFNMVEQLAEAHVVAEKQGLGTDVLHQFLSHMFPGPHTAYSTRMLTGDYISVMNHCLPSIWLVRMRVTQEV